MKLLGIFVTIVILIILIAVAQFILNIFDFSLGPIISSILHVNIMNYADGVAGQLNQPIAVMFGGLALIILIYLLSLVREESGYNY